MITPQKLPEDCPYFSTCNGKLCYCNRATLSPHMLEKLGLLCEKYVVPEPLYRFCIEEFSEEEKEIFLVLSGIERHNDFHLASEGELIASPNNKDEHVYLLRQYDNFVYRGQVRSVAKFPGGELISHYEQTAKKAKEHAITQRIIEGSKPRPSSVNLETSTEDSKDVPSGAKSSNNTASPLSPEDQLLLGFPNTLH